MKKQFTTLFFALLLTFSLAAVCFAEEKQAEAPVDPNATNLTAVYPVLEDAVPAVPVDNYLKAVQKYIDGTTNDLNKIIEQRNKAIASANKVVEDYNAFFEANKQK